jgi:outer membrane protein assembly factor BamB
MLRPQRVLTTAAGLPSHPVPSAGKPGEPAPAAGVTASEAARAIFHQRALSPDVVWTKQAPGWFYHPLVGADGTIYAACGDGSLHAYAPDGTLRWRCAELGLITEQPAQAPDGTLYVGNGDATLIALRPDGTEKWRFKTGYGSVGAPTVGPDGHSIYFGGLDNHVYCVRDDGDRGVQQWSFETRGAVAAAPLVTDEGWTYVGDLFGDLHAIGPDGKQRWSRQTHEAFRGPVARGLDESILMTRWKTLSALDPRSGQERWSQAASPARESGPAVAPDGTIYVAQHDNTLRAFWPGGDEKWHCNAAGPLATTPVVAPDGSIVSRDMHRGLYAFTPQGTLRWSFPMRDGCQGASIMSAPAAGADGAVYAGNNDGTLTALRMPSLEERVAAEKEHPPPHIERGDGCVVIDGVRVPVREPLNSTRPLPFRRHS